MNNIILRADKLRKRLDSGFSLDIDNLCFEKGQIYGLVGPNGAGKTTLLNILSLLDRPSDGEIFFENERISKSNLFAMRRKMYMITENAFLFSGTVFDNIVAGLRFRRVDSRKWQGLVDRVLEIVGLENFNCRNIKKLSVGESQRVALARAIVLTPRILFLDEPFVNIDRQSICLIEDYIRTAPKNYQTTIIFTTHDLYQAWRLSKQVISLVNGRIVKAPLDNFFAGLPEEENGAYFIRISKNIRIAIPQKVDTKCNICIHPEDIVISKQELDSSARNSFKGVIKSIHAEDGIIRMAIRIDSFVELTILITVKSYQALQLAINSEVFTVFKATSVIIF